MSLNWETSDTYFFVDQEHKMMLIQNPGWDSNRDNGKGDSIGRTFVSYFNYGDERFLEGIESCWVKKDRNWFWKLLGKKYYYKGYRYPNHNNLEGLSRDHLIYTILTYKLSGYSHESLKEFIKHLRYKISSFASFTIGLWLWARAISGSKFYEWLFYTIEIPLYKIYRLWNKIIYKITPFEEDNSQDNWIKIQNELKPKRIVKMAGLLFPVYTLHQQAWKIYLLPDSKKKRKLQKICLDIVPKHNYVIKMLLGDKESFTKEDVWNYKGMTSDRWTGILNPWINDRDMNIITDKKLIKYNNQDVDYVRKLYNTVQCKKVKEIN